MKFHVITPFSRPQNLPALEEMFKLAIAPRPFQHGRNWDGAEVWHPICHEAAHWNAVTASVEAGRMAALGVKTTICKPEDWEGWDICYWKCNRALEVIGLADEDYYGFLCDDDTYDPDFFTRLRDVANHTNAEVIVVSERRYGGSPTFFGGILHAQAGNMRPCHIGLEQFFVKGSVMKQYRFGNHGCADGQMAETDLSKHRCAYVPDLFVNWNILPK